MPPAGISGLARSGGDAPVESLKNPLRFTNRLRTAAAACPQPLAPAAAGLWARYGPRSLPAALTPVDRRPPAGRQCRRARYGRRPCLPRPPQPSTGRAGPTAQAIRRPEPPRGPQLFPPPPRLGRDRRNADRGEPGRGGAVPGHLGHRARLSAGAHRGPARPGAVASSRPRRAWCSTRSSSPNSRERLEEACREYGCPVPVGARSRPEPVPVLSGHRRRRSGPARSTSSTRDYFKRIDALNYTMMHDDGQLPRRSRERRRHPGRHQPHLEDADLHLSRQSRHQDRQHPARARHPAAAAPRRGQEAAGGRARREPRADRADPAEPPPDAERARRTAPMSTRPRWRRRWPTRASSAPGTTGR